MEKCQHEVVFLFLHGYTLLYSPFLLFLLVSPQWEETGSYKNRGDNIGKKIFGKKLQCVLYCSNSAL